ncbi:glutaredoxin-like protein NrdH [Arthrobacter subterraneus]|uniref:Glutaredoxin-like protein NrdH n=1 Tax=Arthrobacter subterraneus TaxID=335973 RepID=A0A1G8MSD9_9MICC|nr:glutaredoxin family protein [Arthrobacter subterraneus]SDI70824.1 glutaredoxin-like protein NrdH [Arthrobacter subterraneus]
MTLTIYTKPGCFPCRKTIEKFQDAGLSPQIVDVSTTPAALEYITEELGYSQAPVVMYDKDGSEDHWSGLNPTKISHVIELHTS